MFEVYLSKPSNSKPKLILNSKLPTLKLPPKLLNKQTTDSCINRRAEPYRSAFAMKRTLILIQPSWLKINYYFAGRRGRRVKLGMYREDIK